jgi:hypothetical protein
MRYFRAGVVWVGVAAALVVSTALVVRYLPDTPDDIGAETGSAPVEQSSSTAAPSPAEPAATAEPQADSAGGNSMAADTPSAVSPGDKPSVSSNTPEGEHVAEFVPTIPPPVPPAEPLEIVPGGILNFRSLPPDSAALEKNDQSAARESGLPASQRAANERLRLTSEQAEKVRIVLLSHTIMQSEQEFPLRIGGTVPQNIDLIPLPREVAAAVPGYANYSYVFTQNQLVIVITTSREIDLLIPA